MDESYKKYLKSELRMHCKGMSKGAIKEFLYYTEKAYDREFEIAIKAGAEASGAGEFGFETLMGMLNTQIEDWKEGSAERELKKLKPYPKFEQLSFSFVLDTTPDQSFEKA